MRGKAKSFGNVGKDADSEDKILSNAHTLPADSSHRQANLHSYNKQGTQLIPSPTDEELANEHAAGETLTIQEMKAKGERLFVQTPARTVEEPHRISSTMEEGSNHIKGSVYPRSREPDAKGEREG